jgi:hypothetical protein
MTEAEWHCCTSPQPMLEFLRGRASDRKLRLFACGCCRRIWDRLVDGRSRRAVEVLEQHIEARANDGQLQAAGTEAEEAYRSLKRQALASVVGLELARRADGESRGLFDLTDPQTAREAHDAADRDTAALAASAVWSATATEVELRDTGYSLTDTVIGTANQAAAIVDDLPGEESAQAG